MLYKVCIIQTLKYHLNKISVDFCPILITNIIHFKIGEEAAQFILDLPSDSDMSDLDELSVDEDLNDFSEDENTNVSNEDPKHLLT